MNGSIRFRLIGLPPSTNNLYTIVAGRQVLSRAGRSYHEAVAALAAEAHPDVPATGPIALRITYRLGNHDRDVDGSHKALIDGMSGVCFTDDRQVVLLSLHKTRAAADELPSVEVAVRQLASLPADRTLHAGRDGFRLTTTLLPPSTNNSYAIAGRVRRKTREAKMVETAYRGAFTRLAAGSPPLEGPVRVRIHYGFTADRRDVDGSHKLLLDAARGLLWVDDRQIRSLTLTKARSSGEPRLELAGEGS
jgi:Holliday junction resolvase RusA-like endonuclease